MISMSTTCIIASDCSASRKDVEYYPNIGPNGVDTSGTLIMKYDGFSAVCTGTKDSDSPGYISIQG